MWKTTPGLLHNHWFQYSKSEPLSAKLGVKLAMSASLPLSKEPR